MNPNLAIFLLAATVIATLPCVQADELDVFCLNSGADCVYVDDGNDIPAACVRQGATTVCTPNDDLPDYGVDGNGVCTAEEETYSEWDDGGDGHRIDRTQYCLVGPGGVDCTTTDSEWYYDGWWGAALYYWGTSKDCAVGVGGGHVACYDHDREAHPGTGGPEGHTEMYYTETYVFCVA